ncbi:cation diffusion facilitator family transporter [Gammaproteobacteria bacterium]|nr:cation diffusion facilitator family transporter [Gammaproteobacteria bacterium]
MNKRLQVVTKVTFVFALGNLFLGMLQFIIGWLYFSWSLMADGLHTLSDLLCDAMVFVAAKISSTPPDLEHPYGHQKVETMATVLISIFLIVIATLLVWEVVFSVHDIEYISGFWPFVVALYSVVQNEILYQFGSYQAKKINSDMLLATAWHQRSDAMSSCIVLIALIARHYGLYWADYVAAFCIALFIYRMSLSMLWNAINELLDTAVNPKALATIKHLIESHQDVLLCQKIRTRQVSGQIYLDAAIVLRQGLSLSDAQLIKFEIQEGLQEKSGLMIVDCLLDLSSE